MKRGEQSKWQVRGVAAVALVSAVAMAFAASAAAIPALDSYTPRAPNASGKPSDGVPKGGSKSGSESISSTGSGSGSSAAGNGQETQSGKDQETIDTIASSEKLGAPKSGAIEAAGSSSPTEERSAPAATGSALTEPWSIALILALAGIVLFVILRRMRGDAPQ